MPTVNDRRESTPIEYLAGSVVSRLSTTHLYHWDHREHRQTTYKTIPRHGHSYPYRCIMHICQHKRVPCDARSQAQYKPPPASQCMQARHISVIQHASMPPCPLWPPCHLQMSSHGTRQHSSSLTHCPHGQQRGGAHQTRHHAFPLHARDESESHAIGGNSPKHLELSRQPY